MSCRKILNVTIVSLALLLVANSFSEAQQTAEKLPSADKSENHETKLPADSKQKTDEKKGAENSAATGITLGTEAKYRWRVGVKIVTGNNSCKNLLVTIPLPNDWPEQTVTLDEDNIPSSVHDITVRDLDSGVKQLVIRLRKIPAKTILEIDQTYSVAVQEIKAPTLTDGFVVPKKPSRDIKQYLGVSPGISYRNAKLRKQVKKIVADHDKAWQRVEAIYDWVRDNIEYRDGEPEDCISAFRSKSGCADDLVGLFIAMCRCHKVPARTVWVEGHQLAEFYLHDEEGKGHWFPCNVAGLRDFGSNSDPRIILQKGDNIKVPEKENRQRYVAEFVVGSGNSKPAVGFVRDLLPAK